MVVVLIVVALAAAAGAGPAGARACKTGTRWAKVSVVRDGVDTAVAAARDGAWVAYWTTDGVLNLWETRARKVTQRYLPDGLGGSEPVWSPVGTVAFWTDAGLTVYDPANRRARVVEAGGRRPPHYGFDARGRLYWIPVDSTELWREGETTAVATLPAKWNAFTFGTVLSCDGVPNEPARGCRNVWITDLETLGTTTAYAGGDQTAWEPLLSPTRDRLCYLRGGIRCVTLADGHDTLVDRTDAWGHVGYESERPFSDDGRSLVYLAGGRLKVHSFATARSRELAAGLGYQDVMFWGADHLLLFENWGDGRTRPMTAMARMSIASGAVEPMVCDDTTYTVPVLIHGRTDLLFAGRETEDGGREEVVINWPGH